MPYKMRNVRVLTIQSYSLVYEMVQNNKLTTNTRKASNIRFHKILIAIIGPGLLERK
jgi:hypothetical protein